MEFEAKRFVRRILLIHGGLLLLVLLIVGAAVRLVYASARQQAILQAERKQELLAKQMSLSIANYYDSVTNVLNLLQPSGTSSTQPSSRPTGGRRFDRGEFGRGDVGRTEAGRSEPSQDGPPLDGRSRAGPGEPTSRESFPNGRFNALTREQRRRALESGPMSGFLGGLPVAVWENIRGKASTLFVVDPVDDFAIVRVIGTTDPSLDPARIVASERDWIGTVHSKSVSPYLDLDAPPSTMPTTMPTAITTTSTTTGSSRNNGHLVSMPLRGPGGLLMVAFVPLSSLENDILNSVNQSQLTGVTLIDDKGTFMSAADPKVVGHNIRELDDPRIRELADKYITTHSGGSDVFESPRMLGSIVLPPGISTVEPAKVLGQQWSVVLRSTFDEVDSVVKPIFRDAALWSGFLVVAMTVILISTSSQLILGRVRLERMQRLVMSREIDEARRIQLNWLPTGSCTDKSVDVAATNIPAQHISGDFYNWFDLPDGRTVVSIGDVTGHGMAAAFLMATTQLLVRNTMSRVHDPGEALEEVNRQLCVQAFAGQFVTLNILVIDTVRGTMLLANAGHPAPLVGPGADGSFTSMDVEPQLVLAVDPDAKYPAQSFELNEDSTMILYTDGVLDAVAPDGKRYKINGLVDSLNGVNGTAEQAIDAIRNSVDSFRAGRDLPDDLTIVAIRFEPEASRKSVASVI